MSNNNFNTSFEMELSIRNFASEVNQIENLAILRARLKEQIKQSFAILNKVRSSLLNAALKCKGCGKVGIDSLAEKDFSELSLEQQCVYRYQSDLINRSEDLVELKKLLVESFRVNLFYDKQTKSLLPKSEVEHCKECLKKNY